MNHNGYDKTGSGEGDDESLGQPTDVTTDVATEETGGEHKPVESKAQVESATR